MKLSKKTIYSILLMLALAKNENKGTISMKEIAEKENISAKYLEQIVNVLCKSGLVRSHRGSKGGYSLSKSADRYTLGSIIRTIDGTVSVEHIDGAESFCDFWQGLCNTVNNYMDSVTISDLLEDEKLKNDIYDYCI